MSLLGLKELLNVDRAGGTPTGVVVWSVSHVGGGPAGVVDGALLRIDRELGVDGILWEAMFDGLLLFPNAKAIELELARNKRGDATPQFPRTFTLHAFVTNAVTNAECSMVASPDDGVQK